jgi:hypothetical protein
MLGNANRMTRMKYCGAKYTWNLPPRSLELRLMLEKLGYDVVAEVFRSRELYAMVPGSRRT